MILEGGDFNGSLSASQQNIDQYCIAYSFQQCKREKKKGEDLQNLCHPTKNEPSLPVLVGLKVHVKTGKSSLVDTLADEGLSITYDQVLEIR